MTDPTVALVRRWAVDWLNGRHPEACDDVLAPHYSLLIGGYLLGPRETYVPATLAQLDRYPGLVVTVHQLIAAPGRVAISFTEHGASVRLGGRVAAWTGVALFRGDGRQLTHCFAEEDYYGRRRQLDAGVCDPIQPPAAAPWDETPAPPDASAEDVVRRWLGQPGRGDVAYDDEVAGQPAMPLLAPTGCQVAELFSAGAQVAFSAVLTGRYLGGLDGLAHRVGDSAQVSIAGLVHVTDGRVAAGRVVRDRLGMARTMQESSPACVGQPDG